MLGIRPNTEASNTCSVRSVLHFGLGIVRFWSLLGFGFGAATGALVLDWIMQIAIEYQYCRFRVGIMVKLVLT